MLHRYAFPIPCRQALTAALLLTALGGSFSAQAQRWETAVHLTAASFRFRGAAAVEDSYLSRTDNAPALTTANPYGARASFSYGLALQQQRVTRAGILLGLQAGYERLRSRVDTRAVIGPGLKNELGYGRTYLGNEFVNLHPYLGQRTTLGPVAVDLSGGVDLGVLLRSREQGYFRGNDGTRYRVAHKREQPGLDLRPRLNLAAYYRHLGLTLGYSVGLTNYGRDVPGRYNQNEAYSRAWRLGLAYRL